MFFVNVPAPTEIYTLSLHDALPISTPQPEEATTCIPTRPWHCGDPPEHSSGTFSSRRRTITTGTRTRFRCSRIKKQRRVQRNAFSGRIARSEERRVGKEWEQRWKPEDAKNRSNVS